MTDVTALLQSALDDEPPASFTPVDILEKARSARRRRHGFALAGTSGVAAGVVALVLVLGGTVQGHSPRLAAQLSLAALEHTAATGRVGHSAKAGPVHKVGRVSTSDLAALVEQDTGVTLADIDVAALPPAGVINMSAGIAVTGDPYLNVQVAPAHTMDTTTPSCAELSDLNSGSGDGFYGPCSITQQPDGSTLVVRSGETATGGYTMALALLIRPDGSGIFAENTNQGVQPSGQLSWFKTSASKLHRSGPAQSSVPPAVRSEPVLDSQAMATLVLDLSSQGVSS